jgi:serine-type D-Ala-D-Ala carboxypeptidase (penicillin-binding protein 5/6)
MRHQHSSIRPRWCGVAVHAVIAAALAASIGAATAAAEPLREGVPNGNADAEEFADNNSSGDPLPSSPPVFLPATTAAAAIVMNRDTGEVLGAENPDLKWAPASTTKMMTALLTAEEINAGTVALSDTVTIQSDVDIEGGGEIGLAPGDTISLRDLLHIALLASENDAASAVGTYVGSQPEQDPSDIGRAKFVRRMNQRAGELGLLNTHYINIAGRDPEDLGAENEEPENYWEDQEVCVGNDFTNRPCKHYTTARDLADLARTLLDEPLLATLVQRTSWTTTTWRSASGAVLDRTVNTTNQLLPGGTSAYPGVYGVKTGTTHRARQNLVSAARVWYGDIIAVVLGSDDTSAPGNRYTDSRALLDWGLDPTRWITDSTPAAIP